MLLITLHTLHEKMLDSVILKAFFMIAPLAQVPWCNCLMEKVVQSEGLLECCFSEEEISSFASEAEDILYKYWQCIQDVRYTRVMNMKNKFPTIKIKYSNIIQTAIKHFYARDCTKITDVLALNCSAKNKKCGLYELMHNWYIKYEKGLSEGKSRQKQKKKKGIPKNLGVLLKKKTLQECRCCNKKEMETGIFLACKECIKDKFPDVNYFCSAACKDTWWEKEHMADHLEFSLGHSNFE